MIIKNTTDKKTPKVIGLGPYWIMPGEEKSIPDEFVYVREFDKFDRPTGRKILLPAVAVQKKLGMLEIATPTIGPDNAPAVPKDDENDATAEEEKAEDKPKRRARKTSKTSAPAADTVETPEE